MLEYATQPSNGSGTAGEASNGNCPAGAALSGESISSQTALHRFEQEACRGVLDTGHYHCPYYVWGNGPPVLFIHGIASTARSFVPLIARLTEDLTCICYTLPSGVGDGASLVHYRHADYVEDILRLLDHLQLSQCAIFGASFGTTIALQAMHDHPQRFSRAALQGAFARIHLSIPERIGARLVSHWRRSLRDVPGHGAFTSLGNSRFFQRCPKDMLDFFLECAGDVPMKAVGCRAILLDSLDLRPILGKIRQSILLIRGDLDSVVHSRYGQEVERGLPNARCVEIPTCGHSPEFTHPDLLAKLIRMFMSPPCSADLQTCPMPGWSHPS